MALADGGIVAAGHWERDPRARPALARAAGRRRRAAWERRWGTRRPRRATAAAALPGGDLALAGHVAAGGLRHPFVARVAADGTPRWERSFTAHELPSAVAATPDGGLVLAGLRIGGDRTRAAVRRLDGDGRELWARTLEPAA